MKIQANKIYNLIQKATISGLIPTCLLQFEETGVKVKVQSSNVVFVKTFLDRNAFQEYSTDLGDVGIKNSQI